MKDKIISRKYYKARMWKITQVLSCCGRHQYRYVKHYEKRNSVGGAWTYIRGIVEPKIINN